MAAPKRVVQAVQAGIVASAHLNAFQHVMAATAACERLGGLTSGRWRTAARDLDALQEKLQTALNGAIEELTSRADDLGVPEDALWAVGDAAATLDLLRESALDALDDDESLAGRIIDGEVLFGASFIEDPDLPDRGTTLLFGWSDPLSPASWPWQANWIVGDTDDDVDEEEETDGEIQGEELDLFEAGEPEGEDSLLPDLADQLGCSREEARAALRRAAMALTRASLLAANGDADDEEEDDEDDEANGAI